MLRCELTLGADPWRRLEAGSVEGRITWGDLEPMASKVRIRGAHSRRFPLKSLQVDLTGPHLPDGPPAGHTVRRLHLNADYIDPTLMRSALSYTLFDQMGVPSPRWRHISLAMNRRPVGIYLALESVDADFCRRRGWPLGALYYAINRDANFGLVSPFTRELKQPLDLGYKRLHGADPAPLRTMITELNLATDDEFANTADRWIDLQGYLHWLMVAVFVGNRDGFVHNYALYRSPEDGRFRIIPWDYDATWGIDVNGRPVRLDRVPVGGWNKLSWRLLRDPQWGQRYRQLFGAALQERLSPDQVLRDIDNLAQALQPYADQIRQRRPDAQPFEAEVERLRRWAKERHGLLLTQLDEL